MSGGEQHRRIDWVGAAAGGTVGDGRARDGVALATDAGHPRRHGVVDPGEGQETVGADLHVPLELPVEREREGEVDGGLIVVT